MFDQRKEQARSTRRLRAKRVPPATQEPVWKTDRSTVRPRGEDKTTSGRDVQVRVPPKDRPHRQECLDDMVDVFRELPGLTFIFMANDETDHWDVTDFGPDIVSAVALLCAASTGMSFAGPYNQPNGNLGSKVLARRQMRAEKAIKARVAQLKRRKDTTFILCWCAAGQRHGRTDCSAGFSDRGIFEELVDFLKNELSSYVS